MTVLNSGGVTRRTLIAGAGAAALGSRLPNRSAAESQVLRLLCWAGYDNAGAIKRFQTDTGFRVASDHIAANDEIFLALRAGGIGKYDLVTPGNGVIAALVADGLIQPLDEGRLTSTADCFSMFQRPDWSVVNGQFYAAPYVWGAVPMIYASKSMAAPAAWTDLLTARFDDKIILTNDSVSNIMIWNRALGAADPAHVTRQQLEATISALLRIKREQAAAYTADMETVAEQLAAGKAWVATTGWESVPMFPAAKGAGLEIARPNPGSFSFCDNLCLVTKAPNPSAAHAFIDHLRAADEQAILMNSMKQATVNAKAVAKLDDVARAAFDYENLAGFIARNPFYGFPPFQDTAADVATYVDWVNVWEEVNGAKLNSKPKAGPFSAASPSAGASPTPS